MKGKPWKTDEREMELCDAGEIYTTHLHSIQEPLKMLVFMSPRLLEMLERFFPGVNDQSLRKKGRV